MSVSLIAEMVASQSISTMSVHLVCLNKVVCEISVLLWHFMN